MMEVKLETRKSFQDTYFACKISANPTVILQKTLLRKYIEFPITC